MASYGYDAAGRRNAFNGGLTTSYGYDPVGRLSSLTNNLPASSYNNQFTFGYTPASQIASLTKSNTAFAFAGTYNVNRPYTTNGLNQYTAAGAASFSYDANGNLTGDGSNSFLYDIENRLVTASGIKNASLRYDPLGRLYEVAGAGGTTRFLYDGDALIGEFDASGNLLRRYVHGTDAGADDPVAWYEGASFTGAAERFMRPDWQGSIAVPRAITPYRKPSHPHHRPNPPPARPALQLHNQIERPSHIRHHIVRPHPHAGLQHQQRKLIDRPLRRSAVDMDQPTLAAASTHLDVTAAPDAIAALVAGPLFATYSKNPALAFDNGARLARREALEPALAGEIDAAPRWLDRTAADHAALSAVVRNLSTRGLKGSVYVTFDGGARVTVRLNRELAIEGAVIWASDGQIGVQFDQSIDVSGVLSDLARPALRGQVNRAPRLAIACDGELTIADRTLAIDVQDISQRGIKARTSYVRAGDEVTVRLEGLEPRKAVVRWTGPGTAGFAFLRPFGFEELAAWVIKRHHRATARPAGVAVAGAH